MLLLKLSWQRSLKLSNLGAMDDIPLLFGDETKGVNFEKKGSIIFITGDMQGGARFAAQPVIT
jgi:hypothetical protein